MGNYSYLLDQELHYKDKKKFMESLIAMKCCGDKNWMLDEFDTDKVEFTFDEAKIWAYFSEDLCKTFEEINNIGLRGWMEFEYECCQKLKIYFTDDGVYVYVSPEYLYDDNIEVDYFSESEDEGDPGLYVIRDDEMFMIYRFDYPDFVKDDYEFWHDRNILSYTAYKAKLKEFKVQQKIERMKRKEEKNGAKQVGETGSGAGEGKQ
jgi:hypothetical protein